MLRKLFGFKIWLPIMVVCMLGLVVMYPAAKKEEAPIIKEESGRFKSMPKKDFFAVPMPAPAQPPPPKRDYFKEALTYGGGFSVLVNLINFLGKIAIGFRWIWAKIRRKHDQ